jgi:hypothetical protein
MNHFPLRCYSYHDCVVRCGLSIIYLDAVVVIASPEPGAIEGARELSKSMSYVLFIGLWSLQSLSPPSIIGMSPLLRGGGAERAGGRRGNMQKLPVEQGDALQTANCKLHTTLRTVRRT